jgi:hypothetical protein
MNLTPGNKTDRTQAHWLVHLRARCSPFSQPARVIDIALVVLLFFGAHAAYRDSTGHVQNCDSTYSLVVAEKLLAEGSVNLAGCIPVDPAARQAMQGYTPPGHDLPYQLIRHTDPRRPNDPPAIYYGYPLGSTLLSAPFVSAIESRKGLSAFHADGKPNTGVEDQLQLRIAATVSATIVALFYVMSRYFCSPWLSLLIALGFAFGSPVWSTLARSLWSHTWMVALLSGAIVTLLARRGIEQARWRSELALGVVLGSLLFWMLLTRAHGIFSAAAIGLYLLVHHRRLLGATLGTGTLWMMGLVAVSLHAFGTYSPPSVYSSETIDGRDIWNRFAWLMVSPSRGLLVYCPYLLVVGGILFVFRKHVRDAGLLLPAGVSIAALTLLLSCYNGWHMGSSYGPRYFCDLLPWFVLATVIAVQAVQSSPVSVWKKRIAAGLLTLGFAWGVFVHGRGANSVQAWLWNARAIAVGEEESVKDWRHPQFLGGLTFEVKRDGSIVER